MKDNLTEIVAILDRSGSMHGEIDDAIGGFNTFLKDQQDVDGEANMTVVMFDNEYEVPQDNVDIKEVPALTRKTYVPRGSTALYDAIGRTVIAVGARLDKMDEADRPSKVAVMIVTDGMENASNEFDHDTIKRMIDKQQEEFKWEFIFLSSDLTAIKTAKSFGIKGTNMMNTGAQGPRGIIGASGANGSYACASKSLSNYRAGGEVDLGQDGEN